ncbi:MAG: hypothetical protein K8R88_09845 [Armatimonadetes bacterium]|nr:hypothetical protein [Armatimonadota bacterium]
MRLKHFFLGVCLFATASSSAVSGKSYQYPFSSRAFRSFVVDSFRETPNNMDATFQYLNVQSQKLNGKPLKAWLASQKQKVTGVGEVRAKQEMEIGNAYWAFIKKAIPKFSLERGFEFHFMVSKGERQCFLQSVLMSSMFQETGLRGGVIMIWKNPTGGESNNGHAAVLLRLANNTDVIVDCSDPEPFIKHQGVFFFSPSTKSYQFANPVYNSDSATIAGYKVAGSTKQVAPSFAWPLDTKFLASQFEYYRGEREPKGVFYGNVTKTGLRGSLKHLQESVRRCPQNPLAVFMLGKAQERLGKKAQAKKTYASAKKLYTKYGWTPDNVKAK